MNIREELKKYGLSIRYSEAKDREIIDFDIEDETDNVAWVWGSNPADDVQMECSHPEQCMEWGADDEQGVCKLCGATCTWHYGKDEGNVENFYWSYDTRIPDTWTYPKHIGGIVGEYLDELRRSW